MAVIRNLVVKISADISSLSKGLQSAQKHIQKVSSTFTKAGTKLTASITVPLIALGSTAVNVSQKFEQSMANAASVAGATGDELARMSHQQNMKRYILEFILPINALDMNCDNIREKYYLNNEAWFLYEGYNRNQYMNNAIPLDFYRNKFIVETLLLKYFWNQEVYGQCIPDYHIDASTIEIYKEEEIIQI